MSVGRPPGPAAEKGEASGNNNNDNDINNGGCAIPKIPPEVLAALRSRHGAGGKDPAAAGSPLRSHLSLIVLGHVDAGKSTLTGRLLLALRHVSPRLLAKHQRDAAALGKASFALAWFTDEDEGERERGVTVDVATKFARTQNFDLTLLDAPGHRDFVPNAIRGTAGADAGLLVVAATTGEFEAGFARGEGGGGAGGQTREHAVLSRGLGVTQFVVAVNKMDAAEPAWSAARFADVKGQVLDFLKASGFQEKRITFVPVSGLTGVNVVREEDGRTKRENEEGWKALQRWYTGPTLVEALDALVPAKREFEKPLRLIISDVSSEGRTVMARGRVAQGLMRTGDGVVVLPSGDAAVAARVRRETAAGGADHAVDDVPVLRGCAAAGDTAEVELRGIDAARLSPGCVLCHRHPSLRPPVRRRFEARVLVMERLSMPLIRGATLLLHMHSVDVPAVLSKLMSSERGGTTRQRPRALTGGVTAEVEVALSERLVLEASRECKALGRFALRRGGETVAVGLIDRVLE